MLIANLSYSQGSFSNQNQDSEKFIKITSGLNIVKMRDMATSPLFYTGGLKHFELGYVKWKEGKEREPVFFYFNRKSKQYNQRSYSISASFYLQTYHTQSFIRFGSKTNGT